MERAPRLGIPNQIIIKTSRFVFWAHLHLCCVGLLRRVAPLLIDSPTRRADTGQDRADSGPNDGGIHPLQSCSPTLAGLMQW